MADGQRARAAGVVLRDESDQVYTTHLDRPLPQAQHISLHDEFTVMRPLGIDAADPYQVGDLFDVLVTQPTGLLVAPVEITNIRSEGHVRLWDLRVVGQPWREQRREFVRVGVFGRVTVRSDLLGADTTPLTGYLVDLSEAAMQVSLWTPPDDPRLADGAPVTCDFYAGRTSFTLEGNVLTTRPAATANETWAVIQFDQSPQQADVLRREVFAVQVRMRRAWREIQEAEELGMTDTGPIMTDS